MKIRAVGTETFHADGQTDTTKPLVAFHNFANAPKKTGCSEYRGNQSNSDFERTNHVFLSKIIVLLLKYLLQKSIVIKAVSSLQHYGQFEYILLNKEALILKKHLLVHRNALQT